jgi:hypothetical protein
LDFTRNYIKLDDTLSYIGGLFGFLMILFVFLKVYTEYSYEIDMGDRLYHHSHKEPLDSSKFNFFSFLTYLLYNLLDTLGCGPEWPTMQKFDACRS